MSSPSAGKRRMDTDVIKLIESKHEVGDYIKRFDPNFVLPQLILYHKISN